MSSSNILAVSVGGQLMADGLSGRRGQSVRALVALDTWRALELARSLLLNTVVWTVPSTTTVLELCRISPAMNITAPVRPGSCCF